MSSKTCVHDAGTVWINGNKRKDKSWCKECPFCKEPKQEKHSESGIKRYTFSHFPDCDKPETQVHISRKNGQWFKYADYEEALAKAVMAEREACAEIAESAYKKWGISAHAIAQAIRERKG